MSVLTWGLGHVLCPFPSPMFLGILEQRLCLLCPPGLCGGQGLGYCGAIPASSGDFLVSPSIFILGEVYQVFFHRSKPVQSQAGPPALVAPVMAFFPCGVQELPSLTPSLILAGGLKMTAVVQPSKYFLCFPDDSSQPLSGWLLLLRALAGRCPIRAASWPCVRWAQLLAEEQFHPSMRPWSWGLRKHLCPS